MHTLPLQPKRSPEIAVFGAGGKAGVDVVLAGGDVVLAGGAEVPEDEGGVEVEVVVFD